MLRTLTKESLHINTTSYYIFGQKFYMADPHRWHPTQENRAGKSSAPNAWLDLDMFVSKCTGLSGLTVGSRRLSSPG